MVKAEIDKGQDELKQWVSERKDEFQVCNHVDSEIIPKYAEVMQYIQECGFYNEKGLNDWLEMRLPIHGWLQQLLRKDINWLPLNSPQDH